MTKYLSESLYNETTMTSLINITQLFHKQNGFIKATALSESQNPSKTLIKSKYRKGCVELNWITRYGRKVMILKEKNVGIKWKCSVDENRTDLCYKWVQKSRFDFFKYYYYIYVRNIQLLTPYDTKILEWTRPTVSLDETIYHFKQIFNRIHTYE
jgi:hypothetical protein